MLKAKHGESYGPHSQAGAHWLLIGRCVRTEWLS